jgi:hypothetical protein
LSATELRQYRAPGVRTYLRPGDLVVVEPATGRRIVVRVKAITIPSDTAERLVAAGEDDIVAGILAAEGIVEPELVTVHAATVATTGGTLHPQRGTARAFTAAAVVSRVTGRRLDRILAAEAEHPPPAGPAPRRPRR